MLSKLNLGHKLGNIMRNGIIKLGFKISTLGIRSPKYISLVDNSLKYGNWIKNHDFVVLNPPRGNLYKYLDNNILKNCAICYLEFGVYKGDSLKKWALLNKNKASRFFGFDCFYGLPEEWDSPFNKCTSKGAFSTDGKLPDINDERVKLVQGLFQHTLPSFLEHFKTDNKLVIHLDADLYSSTLYVLTKMDDLLVKDTILIFDEFASVGNEFRAFMDYCSAYKREYSPIAACLPYYTNMAIILD
jgi:hypothetical protein